MAEGTEPMANIAYEEIVLRYVIALHRSGRHLTIPALIQELIEDVGDIEGGTKLESAVRDLDRDGLFCCQRGCIRPTEAGLQAASKPSLVGQSRGPAT